MSYRIGKIGKDLTTLLHGQKYFKMAKKLGLIRSGQIMLGLIMYDLLKCHNPVYGV